MCTLTVVPLPSGAVQVAFNRDESRTRPAGLPPRVCQFGTRAAALPTDPVSGGTWLAVNDAGLALAVLNVNPPERVRLPLRPARSRGAVVPALLESESPSAALAACARLDYRAFAPFRLVLVGQGVVADVRWDGREPMVMSRLVGHSPQMFTSSGLGDHLVEGVRRERFAEMFAGGPETWEEAQYAFHRHRWPGREHLSVNMSRADARTVSYAVLGVREADARFTYRAGAPDQPAAVTTTRLPLAAGAA
ncbi:hypothetical protein GobsT_10630 [Gemmata obscuriglobus]|uniref:NRDE family protein n=1 Tax=Gemmata obscuriglobus TaxID=114 RepID=A0A2Z3H9Z1_9BACT|nr:NRDE family protein [Gemmata obscuriglobus]AWM40436.1 hypothetical protein C1280_27930 [Gemmata obscuriglobus]QEG26324.1 hypothetical protein GobsT_10630 [Gemmata obscuriglobus]VTS01261.1 Uncharacterized protein OS=Vibrionales bacterium (strain SWAT-3) GN=VSWAT3_21510 PE=4 SV=1: NRDE [Gemmata obscuriglobus UQM 2246]